MNGANVYLFVLLISSLEYFIISSPRTFVVETPSGPVRGLVLRTVWNSVKYSSFKGIPYAKPPLGDLRFKVNLSKTLLFFPSVLDLTLISLRGKNKYFLHLTVISTYGQNASVIFHIIVSFILIIAASGSERTMERCVKCFRRGQYVSSVGLRDERI